MHEIVVLKTLDIRQKQNSDPWEMTQKLAEPYNYLSLLSWEVF